MGVQRSLSGLVLRDLVHRVLAASFVLAVRTLRLWNVDLHMITMVPCVSCNGTRQATAPGEEPMRTMIATGKNPRRTAKRARQVGSLTFVLRPCLLVAGRISFALRTSGERWRQAVTQPHDVI